MPSYFKALTTIMVWILFIHGCICLIHSGVIATTSEIVPPIALQTGASVGIGSLIFAAIVVKIRQTLT